MTISGDKFRSSILPNCRRTASQEAKLQSCPFATGSKVSLNDNRSSPSTATGLPESSDEYHTPPEHHSATQNSTNDSHPPPPNTSAVDQDPIPVENDGVETELTSNRQVFDKMPQREQETSNREKRKLPVSMEAQKQKSDRCKHETFTSSLNRVLKMVESRGDGGGGEDDVAFLETAKMRGLAFLVPDGGQHMGLKIKHHGSRNGLCPQTAQPDKLQQPLAMPAPHGFGNANQSVNDDQNI